jgi:predicted DNA-binding transcriptional regulator YafY
VRASRLLSILLTLQAQRTVTAEALAAQFEVSIRTIYRDIDELSASGIPVVADRGPGGGFQLADGYRTQLTGLTANEASSILLAGLPGPAADLGLTDALESAERKVLAALPSAHAARAIHARQRVLLDPLDWYRRVERPAHLADVAAAVWAQTRLSVRYDSWTTTSTVVIDPLGLVIKAGVWYLVARRTQAVRTYKVSQIVECTRLDQRFTAPESFNLADYWAETLVRFERSLQRGVATVRVSGAALSRIERLGADAAEAIRAAPADRHGWRTASIPIEGLEHAAIELLGFGPWIRVITPFALVRRVRTLARKVAAAHA